MVVPALEHGGYQYLKGVNIGTRLGGRKHIIDFVVNEQILISLKWQQVPGTAEQKVPFEVMCLVDAIRQGKGKYSHAYLVLGGSAWTLRDFFCGQGMQTHLRQMEKVKVMTLESFVAKANKGEL